MLAAGLIAARFVHYAALLNLFGAAVFPLYAHRGRGAVADRIDGWLRRACLAATCVALIGGVGWFLFTAATMAGDLAAAADPQVLVSVVRATDFGPLWLARLALLALAAPICVAGPLWRRLRWAVSLLAGLSLASLAGTGHGRAPGGWDGALHAAADAGHLLAAGVWLGALWALAATLALARGDEAATNAEVGELLTRFSGVGVGAVVVLIATGLVNGWYLLGSPERLVTTQYGRVLAVKLALFAGMLGVAAANRYWITPAFISGRSVNDRRWLRRIRRNVLLEQLLGVAIIGAVSVLGTLPTALES